MDNIQTAREPRRYGRLLVHSTRTHTNAIVFLSGVNKYGLTVSCRQDPDGHREWCGYVDVPGEWTATLVLLVVGIVCMCVTTFLLVLSLYKNELLGKAQKVAFAGSKLMYVCVCVCVCVQLSCACSCWMRHMIRLLVC